MREISQWHLAGFRGRAMMETTASLAGALTVAGQWRIFTAFPNILVSLRYESDALSQEIPKEDAQDGRKSKVRLEVSKFRTPVDDTRGAPSPD